jgi:hypothetical protein
VIPSVKSILDITFSGKIWQQGMVKNGGAFLFILHLTFLPVIIDHAILPNLNISRKSLTSVEEVTAISCG